MAIDRTGFNAWVDDDGSGTTGTVLDKATMAVDILDPIDAAIAAPGPATAHHLTHEAGGSDVVDVTALGGYPGATTLFLRGDGTFAEPAAGGGSSIAEYRFDTATSAPPSAGTVRFNAAHPYTAVTTVWLHRLTQGGTDVTAGVLTQAIGTTLYVQDKDDATRYARFRTTDVATDEGDDLRVPVTWVNNGAALVTNQDISVQFAGSGLDVLPTPAANQIAIFHDADTVKGDANLTWNGTTVTGPDAGLVVKVSGPSQITLRDTSAPVNKQIYRIICASGDFAIRGYNDDGIGFAWTPLYFENAAQAVSVGAGRLKFPATQNPSTDVTTLDDYREGTWTPFIGGTGGQSGQSYGTATGTYSKIGRRVNVNFWCALANKGTISGDVILGGLPFACSEPGSIAPLLFVALATNWINVVGLVQGPNAYIYLRGSTVASGGNNTSLTSADISNSTLVVGSASYLTGN